MFLVKEIHLPRSTGSKLEPVALESLRKPFEYVVRQALFSFPYKPDNYYYVISVCEENGTDDFLLIIDPDLELTQDELFVSMVGGIPTVRKYALRFLDERPFLGTVAHASKAVSINTEPLEQN